MEDQRYVKKLRCFTWENIYSHANFYRFKTNKYLRSYKSETKIIKE